METGARLEDGKMLIGDSSTMQPTLRSHDLCYYCDSWCEGYFDFLSNTCSFLDFTLSETKWIDLLAHDQRTVQNLVSTRKLKVRQQNLPLSKSAVNQGMIFLRTPINSCSSSSSPCKEVCSSFCLAQRRQLSIGMRDGDYPLKGFGGGPILVSPVSTFFFSGSAGTLKPSRSFWVLTLL